VSGTTVTLKADDGRVLTVDAAQVGANVRGALQPNEGVTVIGKAGAQPTQFVAQYIQQDSSDPSRGGQVVGQAPAATDPSWQRVHGTVQSVSGTTVTLKADDGRVLTVDAAQVGTSIRGALQPNEGVTVIGKAGAQPTQFVAHFIQQDSSDPSRGGRVAGQAPSASPTATDPSWQRIHGTVQSVSGTTVTLKADDGRVLTVDAAQVGANVRGALQPNEGVTLIGKAGAQPNQFVAQYIQQDSSDPSRGGKVGQPSASPSGSTTK
jgi:uncharacterized protein Veg